MKKLLLLPILITALITSCERPQPPTITAAGRSFSSDGSQNNIQSIHDSQAADGDTITVPNGTFTWTGRLRFTKAVILKGNTTVDVNNGTAVTNTLIKVSNGNQALIELNGNAGQRITGLAFEGTGGGNNDNGIIRVENGSKPFRLDHCNFNKVVANVTVGVFTQNWGVIDHCIRTNSPQVNAGFVHFWPGAHTDKGDSLFEVPAGFGGPNWLFIEDCSLDGGTDITAGGKICMRYTKLWNNNSNGSHGTGRTFPDGRGGRGYEIYNVTYNFTNNYSSVDGPDSGSWLVHDCVVAPHTKGISSQVYRACQSYGAPFYMADGRNAWDQNSGGKPVRILDQPGLGAGAHINRSSPAWPNQADEPCYSWNNTNADDGSQFGYTVSTQCGFTILSGRDYFNGTQLAGYTPYTYPHPLTQEGGQPSATPTAAPTATLPPPPTSTPTVAPTSAPTATPVPTPTPTPVVTPAPTATAVPTAAPTLCTVPNLVGMKVMDAQNKWTQAGFNIPLQSALPGQGNKVSGQSITAGTQADCATTVMTVN